MLEGWFFMTAALLVSSGGMKLHDAEPTRGALRAARLPSSRGVVRTLAVVEIAAGSAVGALDHPAVALLVGCLYFSFGGFVTMAIVRGLPLQSCGCFGRSDTRPGWMHMAVNGAAAAAAFTVAAGGGVDLLSTMSTQPAGGLPYAGFVGIGAFLVALILTDLPAVLAERPG